MPLTPLSPPCPYCGNQVTDSYYYHLNMCLKHVCGACGHQWWEEGGDESGGSGEPFWLGVQFLYHEGSTHYVILQSREYAVSDGMSWISCLLSRVRATEPLGDIWFDNKVMHLLNLGSWSGVMSSKAPSHYLGLPIELLNPLELPMVFTFKPHKGEG